MGSAGVRGKKDYEGKCHKNATHTRTHACVCTLMNKLENFYNKRKLYWKSTLTLIHNEVTLLECIRPLYKE